MTQPGESDSHVGLAFKLNGAAGVRLRELAEREGLSCATLARRILEEIVPKIDTVQQRTVIKLKQAQQ